MFQNMLYGDFNHFKEEFRSVVLHHLSYWLFGKAEHVHEAFVYGIFLAVADTRYTVSIEDEAGLGRLDLSVEETNGPNATIIEFKVSAHTADMLADAQRGLMQIESKQYRARFRESTVHVREYGISFCGKSCEIVGRQVTRTQNADGLRFWVAKDL